MSKPRIFIGSSTEGLEVAQAIQYKLKTKADVVLWNEGIFELTHNYLDSLIKATVDFDYAILLLRADDNVTSRGKLLSVTRGNVVFELGLFLGAIGANRTFVVYDSSKRPDVISDLHGISFATYDGSQSEDLLSAVGPACFQIRQALKQRVAKSGAYGFLDGVWHEYHFTYDPASNGGEICVAHTEICFSVREDHSVHGKGQFVASHRPVYSHYYKGAIRGGTLYYTALCVEIPGDIYCAVYSNLFNRPLAGAITALDYANNEFSSPILLSDKPMSTDEVQSCLYSSPAKYYRPKGSESDA